MAFFPDSETFLRLYQEGVPFLTYETAGADTLTPVGAVSALRRRGVNVMLFESVDQGARRSRYSVIAAGAAQTLRKEHVDSSGMFDMELRRFVAGAACPPAPHTEGLPSAAFGAYGYMGYDTVRCFERLPDSNPRTSAAPDAYFVIPEVTFVFDNASDTLRVVARVDPRLDAASDSVTASLSVRRGLLQWLALASDGAEPLPEPSALPAPIFEEALCASFAKPDFLRAVGRVKEYIFAGDAFQVVLSRRLSMAFPQEKSFEFYRRLRSINPSPYCFYIETDDGRSLAGSSPEVLFRLCNGAVYLRPIAGTRPRGRNEDEDVRNAAELMADQKERAEHLMLVDLCRNDVGRVSKPGTVRVPERDVIEYYSHVMHIVSLTRGELKEGCDAFDVLRAVFPVGTVSGAPKVRAMEIIDELEPERRGFYAGGAGYFSFNGDADLCIILRTALIEGGRLLMQTGAGLVADSDPETEYQETLHKAGALLRAAALCLAEPQA